MKKGLGRMVKKFVVAGILSFTLLTIHAQDVYRNWDPEVIKKANTGTDSDLLSSVEKELILLTNLARIDGSKFSNTILEPYLQGEKTTRYVRSLKRDLEKIKNLDLLFPENDLILVAMEHAETSGKRGTTGHQRFEKRYGPLMGKYIEVGENCAYGYSSAMDILIRLLIDEDIPSLGHRKNILSANFNAIGVSIHSHKKYRYNCVMSFGKKAK